MRELNCLNCRYITVNTRDAPCKSCNIDYANWEPRAPDEVSVDHKPGGSTPSQYGLPAGAKDLQDLIEYRKMNFAQGNIFKAQYRTGHCDHSDALRDARKTLWFAQREVERLEREENDNA